LRSESLRPPRPLPPPGGRRRAATARLAGRAFPGFVLGRPGLPPQARTIRRAPTPHVGLRAWGPPCSPEQSERKRVKASGRQERRSPSHFRTPTPTSCLGCASPPPGPVAGLGERADNADESSRRDRLPKPAMAAADVGREGGSAATRQDAGGAVAATTGAEGGGRGAETTFDVLSSPRHLRWQAQTACRTAQKQGRVIHYPASFR